MLSLEQHKLNSHIYHPICLELEKGILVRITSLRRHHTSEEKLKQQPTCFLPFLEPVAPNPYQMAERLSPTFHPVLYQVMEVPTEQLNHLVL